MSKSFHRDYTLRELGFRWWLRNTTGFRWLGLIIEAYVGWKYHRDWPEGYFWWALKMNFKNRHPWGYRRAMAKGVSSHMP